MKIPSNLPENFFVKCKTGNEEALMLEPCKHFNNEVLEFMLERPVLHAFYKYEAVTVVFKDSMGRERSRTIIPKGKVIVKHESMYPLIITKEEFKKYYTIEEAEGLKPYTDKSIQLPEPVRFYDDLDVFDRLEDLLQLPEISVNYSDLNDIILIIRAKNGNKLIAHEGELVGVREDKIYVFNDKEMSLTCIPRK